MKKVLLVFDGQHFSEGVFEFARRLNEVRPILAVGLFLPSIDYANSMSYYVGMAGPLYVPLLDSQVDNQKSNIERFILLCKKNNLQYRVHNQSDASVLAAIKKETRYADLLLLSGELFYSNLNAHSQKEYLHDTGHTSECPILIVPEIYNSPKSVILAFDGSESSAFAIKQFAYLLPDFTSLETTLVFASEKVQELPDSEYITEFAAQHFPVLTVLKLDVDPKEYFNTWIQEAGPAILVSGSYKRSLMSEAFKKSFIREIIEDHRLPIFITHK